jgi:hypothetical protein
MEVYILDDAFRRVEMIEQYTSMIWTERYNTYGDFQLDIDPLLADPVLKTQGTYLACNYSDRVMYVDSTEDKMQDDGTRILTIKGKSLEALLENRPNDYTAISSGGAVAQIVLGPNTPAELMRNLFDVCCRNNTLMPSDNLPYIQTGTYSPAETIPESTDPVTVQSELGSLYATLANLAEIYRLGFRLIRPADDSKLYFEVYTGYDRTTGQIVNAPIVFSPELDNLTNTNELVSSANQKNVAYVFAPKGSRVVYAPDTDSSVTGFQKKVLIVNASDIDTDAGSLLQTQLLQRGLEELYKTNVVWGFDGEIPKSTGYIYGVNYKLGDLVEQRDNHGFATQMKVTEQIFVSDKEGEKNYPTLTVDTLITPGSWDSLPGNRVWDDYGDTVYWDNM